MKIVKPDNLALLATPCRLDGRRFLSVAVMACFSLEASAAPLHAETELWQTAMAALADGEVLDQGYPKPGAEFVVHGAACAPQPVTGMEITVRVGDLAKTLTVTGDRRWTATGAPGVPTAFTRLPIVWRNAFGGPGYALNPVGKGFRTEADGRRPLPNVQYPGRAVAAPGETPVPAGLGPIPADWPRRQSLLGRFDAAWLAERWPDLPRDASPDYFHTASEDQRLPGFFRGDEEIRLIGLHPEKSTIVCALPRLRARVFVEQIQAEAKSFVEVPTRAETLMLYPEALRGILLFRGTLPAADETLDDITSLVAGWESLAEAALPREKYFEELQAAVNPAPVADPAVPTLPDETVAETGQAPPLPDLPESDALNREVAALEAASAERLKDLGLSRTELLQKYGAEEAGAEVTLEGLAGEIEQFVQRTDEHLRALGVSREALLAKYAPAQATAEPAALPGQVRDLLALSKAQLAAANLTESDLPGHLPQELRTPIPSMAEAEAALAAWEPAAAQAPQADTPDDPMAPAGTALNAAEVLARYRAGASLRGIDAGGADFSGCDLQGADFSEARLDRAGFAGARLQGAIFTGALLQAADFTGADLTGAVLRGAGGPEADFSQARLAGADLSLGDWTGAKFCRADLQTAVLTRALLRTADLTACRLQGAVAPGADLSESVLSEADFTGCDLSGADCSGADLTNAVLAAVRAPGLQVFGATAENTDLRRAALRGLRGGPGTHLTGARLAGADLGEACLGGAQFMAVDLEGAALDDGDFSRAIFAQCNLRNVTARGGRFLKAVFKSSDLRGIDLLQGSLRHATLEKVDLRESSLYGVDLYEATLKETDTRGANLQATLLTLTPKG